MHTYSDNTEMNVACKTKVDYEKYITMVQNTIAIHMHIMELYSYILKIDCVGIYILLWNYTHAYDTIAGLIIIWWLLLKY